MTQSDTMISFVYARRPSSLQLTVQINNSHINVLGHILQWLSQVLSHYGQVSKICILQETSVSRMTIIHVASCIDTARVFKQQVQHTIVWGHPSSLKLTYVGPIYNSSFTRQFWIASNGLWLSIANESKSVPREPCLWNLKCFVTGGLIISWQCTIMLVKNPSCIDCVQATNYDQRQRNAAHSLTVYNTS